MFCQYLIPFFVMIQLLMIKVDIQVHQHKAPKEQWDLIFRATFDSTLREIRLTSAHRCAARQQKHKLHSRVP